MKQNVVKWETRVSAKTKQILYFFLGCVKSSKTDSSHDDLDLPIWIGTDCKEQH